MTEQESKQLLLKALATLDSKLAEAGSEPVEIRVVGGFAPAQIVVVHGRQIVMDEGIGMNALQRPGKGHNRCAAKTVQTGADQTQHGTQPLASGQETVLHGDAQPLWNIRTVKTAAQSRMTDVWGEDYAFFTVQDALQFDPTEQEPLQFDQD